MFELKISDLNKALFLSKTWATHTISLIDPDFFLDVPQPGKNSTLRRYYFHDISKNYPTLEYLKLATLEQIQDILEFTISLQCENKLLIHCHAGISRSTAVACGVLCQHALSPEEAIQHVLSIRPQAFPNEYIISLFDQALNLNGELTYAVTEKIDRFDGDFSDF